MATEEAGPPEGFTKAESSNNENYDTEWADRPELGEVLQGTLLAMKPDRGKYDSTVLEIRLAAPYRDHDEDDLVSVWSTAGIDSLIEQNDVTRGEEFAIGCQETYEGDDGETRRNYEVYVQE